MNKKTTKRAPKKEERYDGGYANLLNKYGTPQDNSTAYQFKPDGIILDTILTQHYEYNGLFARIIEAPAEEALKHGFELEIENPKAEELLHDALEALDWEEKAATAIKWARLYGGAIIVMLIDDGGDLNEPLNRDTIKGIDGMEVYERAIVQPNWESALYGKPQYYMVSSINGYFQVHASRCLVFRNGILPERTMNAIYRHWGLPEYLRIKNELRECVTAHGLGIKLLDRSVQAIYSMKGLNNLLSTDEGEDKVLRRLQLIDRARSIFSSMAIDADSENYDFKNITFAGVKDIIDTSCNQLSAVTSIPQTVLFGRSPAGQNSTGDSDLENYYNLCERIQKMMLKRNLKTLSEIIFISARAENDIDEVPVVKIKFKPLWSLTETEQAAVEQTRAATSQTKAATAQIYVDMGAVDPSEVRKGLADNKEFDIEKVLDDVPESDLMSGWEEPSEADSNNNCVTKSAETLTKSDFSDIINNDNTINDGGAGSGRYPKGSGTSKFSTESYNKAVDGVKTSDGKTVKGMGGHALSQAQTRDVYPSSIAKTLANPEKIEPGNTGNRAVYVKNGLHVVLDNDNNEVVTVIYKGKGKK